MLPSCKSLKSLILDENNVRDDGAVMFAEVLPRCKSLVKVQIEMNSIGSNGVESLRKAQQQAGCPNIIFEKQQEDRIE